MMVASIETTLELWASTVLIVIVAQQLLSALVQIFNLVDTGLCFDCLSCGKYGIPYRGRGFGLNW